MDKFSNCTVILYLKRKGSVLKVKEDMMFTAGEDIPSYKAWWKGGLLSWNVAGRLWKLPGKVSHHYYSGDHCQGSCSIIVERKVQSLKLSQGVSSLGPKVPWIWSEMDSAQLVREERRLSILLQFVTTDEILVHHFQPEMKSQLWKGSMPYKNAKTVMSAGKDVVVYIYRLQEEYCCWTT